MLPQSDAAGGPARPSDRDPRRNHVQASLMHASCRCRALPQQMQLEALPGRRPTCDSRHRSCAGYLMHVSGAASDRHSHEALPDRPALTATEPGHSAGCLTCACLQVSGAASADAAGGPAQTSDLEAVADFAPITPAERAKCEKAFVDKVCMKLLLQSLTEAARCFGFKQRQPLCALYRVCGLVRMCALAS